jgi:hypothetical protein
MAEAKHVADVTLARLSNEGDTPGIHTPGDGLGVYMGQLVRGAAERPGLTNLTRFSHRNKPRYANKIVNAFSAPQDVPPAKTAPEPILRATQMTSFQVRPHAKRRIVLHVLSKKRL